MSQNNHINVENSERTFEDIQHDMELRRGLVFAGEKLVRAATRLKYYGDELAEIAMCDKAVYAPTKAEPNPERKRKRKNKAADAPELAGGIPDPSDDVKAPDGSKIDVSGDSEGVKKSKQRARRRVFDYAMCNPELNFFLTLTLNAEKIDRYDYNAAIKRLNTWLDNRVRRNGLKYIFVAEKHKDGAIHFHGVVNRSSIEKEIIDSGHTDKRGHKVYNLKSWDIGFTTGIDCYGDRSSVCKYITKYITKQGEKVGGRWYLSGGDLVEPRFEYLGNTTPEDWTGLDLNFESYTKCVEEINATFTILSRKW